MILFLGYIKDKVYRTKPRKIDALKLEIERQCHDIPNDLFRDVCESLGEFSWYQRCLDNISHQIEPFAMILQLHLSSVFEAIPFHSMFTNNGFLVIRSVSTFFLYTLCTYIHGT